jgi:hypothetical protein
MNLDAAIAFVHTRGNAVELGRLAAILEGKAPGAEALAELAARQQPDGGFAGWLPLSTVGATAYALQWCDDLRLHTGAIVDAACRFLLERRQPDGGWDEVDAVRAFDPPEWMAPGNPATRAWLTASAAHMLLRHNRAGDMRCRLRRIAGSPFRAGRALAHPPRRRRARAPACAQCRLQSTA